MNNEEITVAVVPSWDAEEIVALYRVAGWWDEVSRADHMIPAIFSGSFAVAVAYNIDKRAVGMGRVLSDGISDAYIQDVVVDPRFRGQGIGKRIVQELVDTCRQAGIGWIALVAEPGTHTFYEPLGFTVMEDYLPMKYEGDTNQ
ncbi:GNAT family N-acetyltransferase [Methanogenium organophilum]|uniref:GNAT family N-acetyltransferase n=1 Tax=Methanogenium organophilum TaxID=2199 RepID=A0A9X9S3N5_METOG|nr:GNAT family N-acetyltransferase [Methanogenium organophilum]WAI00892.1 GNAT family N-acetyltransferase [Methanogenium organophilum]